VSPSAILAIDVIFNG